LRHDFGAHLSTQFDGGASATGETSVSMLPGLVFWLSIQNAIRHSASEQPPVPTSSPFDWA
jgi:hypothetical protein